MRARGIEAERVEEWEGGWDEGWDGEREREREGKRDRTLLLGGVRYVRYMAILFIDGRRRPTEERRR